MFQGQSLATRQTDIALSIQANDAASNDLKLNLETKRPAPDRHTSVEAPRFPIDPLIDLWLQHDRSDVMLLRDHTVTSALITMFFRHRACNTVATCHTNESRSWHESHIKWPLVSCVTSKWSALIRSACPLNPFKPQAVIYSPRRIIATE